MNLYDWTSLLHFVVGGGYVVFAIIVVVFGLELLRWIWPERSSLKVLAILSVLGTTLFLAGCGEHHLHLGYHILYHPESFDIGLVRHMYWDSLVQALGVWGPIPLIFLIRAALIRAAKRANLTKE